jgi:hypothetical protein
MSDFGDGSIWGAGGLLMFVANLFLAVMMQAPAAGPVDVAGRVVDAKGQPIAAAEVLISGLATALRQPEVVARGKSDAQGQFRISVPAPKDPLRANLPLAVWATHAGHALGGVAFTRQSRTQSNVSPLVVKLPAQGNTTVRVVGATGAAVAGAKVMPLSFRVEPAPGSVARGGQITDFPLPGELSERLTITSGPDGRGTIASIAANDLRGVWLEAPGFGRQRSRTTAGPDGTVVLMLAPVGKLAGRVAVDDPKSLQGLKVLVFTWSRSGPNAPSGWAEAVLDESGRFEVPAIAIGDLHINVQVPEDSKRRFVTPQNLSIARDRLTEVTIAERKPVKTRTLAGRIVDVKGAAIAGATVFQSGDAPARTETTSDAEGRFALSGVAKASTFVFARAKGFRFGGRGVKASESDVTITLTREGEPPAVKMATMAPAATPEQERAAAHRLIDGFATRVLEKGDMNAKVKLLEVLARVDPARTLELTEGKTLTVPFLRGMIRMRVATALIGTAPDEAVAVAESIGDPAGRTLALFKAVDALPASEKTKRLELLDRALISARTARQPTGIRMILMAQVAEHWLDMGLTEKGKALIREVQADAEQLPDAAWPGYAKGAFAEELCQVDLDAALKLTKGLSDSRAFDRHHGNIAHELAGKDPAAAERVLGMVKDPYQQDQYTVRVVYRMAPLDLARARRLAAAVVDPVMRGYALGMGALGLAHAKKTAEATALLREAMETLGTVGEYGKSPTRSPCDRASTAAALVAVAERIDPNLVPETFWRALSLRYPRRAEETNDPSGVVDLQVALLLARYDRDVARALVAPRVGPEASAAELTAGRGLAFVAAAVIDPVWALQLVEGLRDDPDVKTYQPKNEARLAAAAVLARHGEARWRYLENHYANLWVADTEDHDPDL